MPTSLKHEKLTKNIIGVFYDVYNDLGHGFIESVYENSFMIALLEFGYEVGNQVKIPVSFRDRVVGNFEADIVVESKVILELKSASCLVPANEAQLLNYLRATDIEVGLLFNFGEKPALKRLIYENSRKRRRGGMSFLDALYQK